VAVLEGRRVSHGLLNLQRFGTRFECRRSEYNEARSAAYYQVTTEFAAHKNVDKERAKSDLEDHQLVCVSAAKMRQSVLLGSLD